MKIFITISAILATAASLPAGTTILTAGPAFYAPAPIRSQYHAQDSLGQYSYGYSGGLSAKAESKTFDGVTRGSYTYIDSNGKLQSVEYTADSLNGFRAAATNLPRAPVDNKIAPEPVEDTPEVAQARAEHLAAFKEAENRAANAEDPEDRQESIETKPAEQPEQPQLPASMENLEPKNIEMEQQAGPQFSTAAITAPLTTIHAVQAVRTLEVPSASYSYSVHAPSYAYRIATPTLLTSPLAYTLAAPAIHTHSGEILADAAEVVEKIKARNNGNASF